MRKKFLRNNPLFLIIRRKFKLDIDSKKNNKNNKVCT
jgi:hypothetical protein